MRQMKETEKLKPFPPPFQSRGRLNARYEEAFNRFQTARGRRFMVIGIVCLFGLLPIVLNDYMLHLFNVVCIYAIVAVGLTIMTGYTGQLSLAHGAFFGIGAYTAALLAAWANLPFFLVIPAAGTVATLFGALLAIPSLRLKPIFLPMATLAGQFIVEYILVYRISLAERSKRVCDAKTGPCRPGPRNEALSFLRYRHFPANGHMAVRQPFKEQNRPRLPRLTAE